MKNAGNREDEANSGDICGLPNDHLKKSNYNQKKPGVFREISVTAYFALKITVIASANKLTFGSVEANGQHQGDLKNDQKRAQHGGVNGKIGHHVGSVS
jgi:hypothetical protein